MTLPAQITNAAGWPDHIATPLGPFAYGSNLFVVLLDRGVTPTRPCVFRSQDGGHVWARQDTANEPDGYASSLSGYRSVSAALADDPQFLVVTFSHTEAGGGGRLGHQRFDLAASSWSGTPLAYGAFFDPRLAGNGTAPIQAATRAADAAGFAVFQRAPSSVMGTAYRRLVYSVVGTDGVPVANAWDPITNVALNDPGDDPGTAGHYDLRGAMRGTDDRVLFLWTLHTTGALQARLWSSPNTMTAIINPGSATVSATAAYPLGQPVVFVRGGVGHYAVPYVDGAAVKVLTCPCTTAHVAGNWTVTTAVGAAGEQTASNPAVVVTDTDKLWLWRVSADAERDLFYTNDQGGGGWSTEAGWKLAEAVRCDGVSSGRVPGGLGVVYLDGSTTPARVRYDRLVVLAAFGSSSAGTFAGAGVDLGVAPPAAVEVLIDVGAGADPAGTVEVAVEGSWDGGAWTTLTNAGPYAQFGVHERIRLEVPPRYLRAITAVGVDASSSGVFGIEEA